MGGAYQPVDFSNPSAPKTGSAPAQSIAGVGAFTPDWGKLISSDPGLLDAQAALNAGGAADQSALNAQIGNAYTEFGSNVDLSQLAQSLGMTQADLQSALGADQQKLAQENTAAGTSTQARLQQANTDAVNQIMANLNKRGLLHSGETGYELDRQNTSYRQAQSDAYQKFLSVLQQYQQGYLTAQGQRSTTLAGAYGDAANRVEQNNHGSPGVTATLDHIGPNGQPVYKGPDGNLYNADGSAYAGGGTANQTAAPTPPAPTGGNVALPYQQAPRGSSSFLAA